MDGVKLVFNALFGLAIFCGILYLAYLSTKYIGKKYSFGGKANGNLKILDSMNLGKDEKLCIVQAGEKYLLVGITSHNISLVSELDEDELKLSENDDENGNTMSFSEALKINMQKKFGKSDKERPKTEEASDNDQKDRADRA